jgi:hypothetical protein
MARTVEHVNHPAVRVDVRDFESTAATGQGKDYPTERRTKRSD